MLSTVGVGTDFNEYLMTAIADAGTGNYYYVSDPRVLSDVFAREFDAARTTVASGLKVQIDPASGVRVIDAAGYPLETSGDGVMFRTGSLFAGQERRIWVTLGIPQTAVGEFDVGRFTLVYNEDAEVGGPVRLSFSETPRIACVESKDEYFAGIDADAWGRSTVVEGYNQMQEDVARLVKEGKREEAVKRVYFFREDAAAMNERVKSAPVANQLGLADKLEGEVRAAFEGPGQEERQNALSKAASADAKDARRAGSKK
jgi:Ca-activated chloride channel family protein